MSVGEGGIAYMGLLDLIRHAGDGNDGTLHECRDCGLTVDPDDDVCPECASTEIACYTFQ